MSSIRLTTFCAIFVTLSTVCLGARILGIIPTPSYSHQVVFYPLWKELSLRGHQVTLCTTDPIKDPTLSNLTEIDWHFAYDLLHKHNFTQIVKDNQSGLFFSVGKFLEMLRDIYDQELSHPEVKMMIDNENEHFDLVMVEYNLPSPMPVFSVTFKCPLIGIVSLDASGYVHSLVGNPTHPILYPDFMLHFEGKLPFFERVAATLLGMYTKSFALMSFDEDKKLVKRHFGGSYPDLDDIWKTIDLLFVNVNPVFQGIRPLAPNTIQIGGGLQLETPKPLPQDIKSFLDNAKEGVVYFSLGTNAKSREIPVETRQIIMDTFKELPYKVLWKFEDDDLPGKPSNVKISKWLPQQDVLRHPNIKVFVTQGGLQSIEEAIYSHVPLVGMPYFGDQPMNVKKLVSRGIGLQVDKDNLDKKSFKNAILEVINNPKYKARVIELAKLALDQPMTGLEKAVWWTEYVLRHKGASHLRSPAIDLPWYQYFLLDVIGFILSILIVSLWLVYRLIRLIVACTCIKQKVDKQKKN